MRSSRALRLALATALLAGTAVTGIATAPLASAHEERTAHFPAGTGSVPAYRQYPAPNRLVVCKPDSGTRIAGFTGALKAKNTALLAECGYSDIQAAVDAVSTAGSTIYVLPGVYQELPSRPDPTGGCATIKGETDASLIGTLQGSGKNPGTPVAISYADQVRCPHALNLIAVLGDSTPGDTSAACDGVLCNLQLEGTGAVPLDVLVDNGFSKLNGLRADRADGFYLKGIAFQQAEFNSVYVLETDGFAIVDGLARANDEYGYLAFASDHGLFDRVEGYFNGDSAIYPGSASDVNGDLTTFEVRRYAIEVRNSHMHHNTLGYSGTAGNSVYVHDNDIHDNATGIATDSFFPNHPGLPQDHARFSNNRIYHNNSNYYEKFVKTGICAKPMPERGYIDGTVCPVIPTPVGTGILIAGGNFNSVDGNQLYDNWRQGTMQIWVPAPLRDEYDPAKLFDTSNGNHYVGNRLGKSPDGLVQPNGTDFWWDDEGKGNCWQDNQALGRDTVGTNSLYPGGLPTCDAGGSLLTPGLLPVQGAGFLGCTQYNRDDPDLRTPPDCDWFDSPTEPAGRQASLSTDNSTDTTPATPSASSSPLAAVVRGAGTLATTGGGAALAVLGFALLLGSIVARRLRQA